MGKIQAAVVGMGAIGSWIFSFLDKAADKAEVFALADGERAERLSRDGVTVNKTKLSVRVRAFTKPPQAYDFIFLASKMAALPGLLEKIAPCVDEKTLLIPLQNGISSERVTAEHYGKGRVLPAIVRVAAGRENGEVTFGQGGGTLSLGLMQDNAHAAKQLSVLAELLRGAGLQVLLPADIRRDSWVKFMWNCSFNQWLAAADVSYGGLKQSPELQGLLRDTAAEILKLSDAEGAGLTAGDAEEMMRSIPLLPDRALPSTLQDLRAGRPTEVEDFAGECLRLARKHDLRLPLTETVYRLIKVKEAKNRGEL